jgi:hypothetical protein
MYYRPQLTPRVPAQRKSNVKKFDAPVAGWISNRSLSAPNAMQGAQGAAVLDNFFPTATMALQRRGKEIYATLGDGDKDVESIFSYVNGLNRKLFSSTADTIYDITSVLSPINWSLADQNGDTLATQDGDTLGEGSTYGKEAFTGALGGNWIVTQFATTGGVYLIGVNGESIGFIYDGSMFYPNLPGGIWAVSYDESSQDFVPGEVVTGGTSAATGTVHENIVEGFNLTRSTTATYWDEDGLLATAAIDVPRYQFNPITHDPEGLLVESAATNICQRSEELDNAYWTKTRSTITPDATVAPTGANTMDKLVEDTSNNTHLMVRAHTVSANTQYVMSFFVKAAERTRLFAQWSTAGETTGIQLRVNTADGTITTTPYGTATNAVSGIEDVGNGIYRCWVGGVADASSTSLDAQFVLLDAAGNLSYLGNGASGLYIWGIQVELGSSPSSYIPTTSASVTRAADIVENYGTLLLTDKTGDFDAGEALTGSLGGSADSTSDSTNVIPGTAFPGSLTTADMSYVWVYRNRLWYIRKDSLDAYYMDNVDAIGGAPKVYPLGGIVQRGGHLVWGDAWSLASGAAGGLSDQMVICTSEGEVAVFQGTFPEDTQTWQVVGTYQIGRPLGNRAHFRGGGDIAVATSVGLIPLSKAISLDVTALSPASVSYNIQDAWQAAVDTRGFDDWQCVLWPERKMAVISPPSPSGTYNPVMFISNTETGAWCRYTNWDGRAMEVFQGQLYFGGPEGKIFRANVSGQDDGATYTSVYIPLFDDFGNPSNQKMAKTGRGVARAKASGLTYSLRFKREFDVVPGAAPAASPVSGANTWGSGVWGQAVWGGELELSITDHWKSVGGAGYACSLCYQITSGSLAPCDAELIRLEMTFTMGEVGS